MSQVTLQLPVGINSVTLSDGSLVPAINGAVAVDPKFVGELLKIGATQGVSLATAQVVTPGAQVSDIVQYPSGSTRQKSYTGGPTPWQRMLGPNELNALTRSAEISSTGKFVTAQQAGNGSAMFRREGAAILIDGSAASSNFGNLNTASPGSVVNPSCSVYSGGSNIAAGALQNTTLALLVYWHRVNANSSVKLRIGLNSGNYITYAWDNFSNVLQEGWNVLLVSTAELLTGASFTGYVDSSNVLHVTAVTHGTIVVGNCLTGNGIAWNLQVQSQLATQGSDISTWQMGLAANATAGLAGGAAGPIGSSGTPVTFGTGSPYGQYAFNSSFSAFTGWQWAAGSFNFSQAIGYLAIETDGIQASATHNSFVWIEGLYYGGYDHSTVTIGFDIQTSGLDLALSSMAQYGYKGYAAVPTANANPATPTYLWAASDVARLQALYNQGWDVIQHSTSHNSMGNYADDGMLLAEIEACREQIMQIGCPRGADLMAMPNNSLSNRVVAIGAKAGLKWMRGTGPVLRSNGLVGDGNPLLSGCVGMSNLADASRITAFVDLLILYGCAGHLYTHAIQTGASDSLNTNVTVFQNVLAYIAAKQQAGLIDPITPSQMVAVKHSWPNVKNILGLPSRLNIVPGASPFDYYNCGYEPYTVTISGGTVSALTYSKDGTNFDSVGATAGQFIVSPGDRLRMTFSSVPTVIQQRLTV